MRRRQFVHTAGVTGLAALAGCLGDGRDGPSAPSVEDGVDHDQDRGEPRATDSLLFAVAPEKLWSFETEDKVLATPTVVDGRAYVGSKDGHLYAFEGEVADGASSDGVDVPMFKVDAANTSAVETVGPTEEVRERWRFDTGGDIWGSPAAVDGTIYVGSESGVVHALDAATGVERWAAEVGGAISPPTVVDGTVYVSAVKVAGIEEHGSGGVEADSPGTVHALDAATGESRWAFERDGRILSPPAVEDGTVYVGCWDTRFYAVDAASGEEEWRFEGADGLYCGTKAALHDGVLYIGNHDARLYGIDAADGSLVWSFTADDKVVSSPVATDDGVFVGSLDDRLYALEPSTGEERWRFEADGPIASSPAYRDGVLYVGSSDDRLYAVDASSGDGIWTYATGESVISSPLVTDDAIYVGSNDTRIYALRNATLDGTERDTDGTPARTPEDTSGTEERRGQ